MDELTNTALSALDLGCSVIPVGEDKASLVAWTPFQSQRPSADQILSWAESLRPPAWAIVTGEISGLIVLDFDGEVGMDTLRRLGLDPHIRTGGGGAHVYVEHPGWRVQNVQSKSNRTMREVFPGMDVRGDGGYAVFAGRTGKGDYVQLRPF